MQFSLLVVNVKNKLLKTIRIITIPPIVVTTILILFIYKGIIVTTIDKVLLLLFLGILPTLGYFINYLLKGNREKERKLSFIFTIISYGLGFIYAIIYNTPEEVKFIYYIYFFSSVILTIFNLLKLKASGHTASITGFVLLLFLFINKFTLLFTLPVYLLVTYSSVSLKRHKPLDLVLGTISIAIAYFISYLII